MFVSWGSCCFNTLFQNFAEVHRNLARMSNRSALTKGDKPQLGLPTPLTTLAVQRAQTHPSALPEAATLIPVVSHLCLRPKQLPSGKEGRWEDKLSDHQISVYFTANWI